jgi:intracellular septation protein A
MQWQLLFLSIAPVAAFVVADRFGTQRRAVTLAVAVSGFEFLYNSFQLALVEPFSLGSFVLFLVLGSISIKRQDLSFFKFQPVVFEILIAGTFIVYTFALDTPLFAIILEDSIGMNEWVPPYQRGYFAVYAQTLSKSIPFLLLLHAALTAHAALRRSTWWWFHCRVFGLYLMIVALFFTERIFQATY